MNCPFQVVSKVDKETNEYVVSRINLFHKKHPKYSSNLTENMKIFSDINKELREYAIELW